MKAEARAKKLREEIAHHDHQYYVLDAPEIADAEYDALFCELQALEAEHPALRTADSPTQRVGGKPQDAFKQYTREKPMLSLSNIYNKEELREFDAVRVVRCGFVNGVTHCRTARQLRCIDLTKTARVVDAGERWTINMSAMPIASAPQPATSHRYGNGFIRSLLLRRAAGDGIAVVPLRDPWRS